MRTDPAADLAVVGGGIIGCFVAYQAIRSRPDRRVVLVERTAVGAGATGWSAGVSFPLATTAAHRRLVRASASAYEQLRDTPAARMLRPRRMVYVVGREGAAALRERVVDAGLRAVTEDERARVERMLPDLRLAENERLLTHDGHGFVVDAEGLARWLVAEGVTVRLGDAVTGVEPDGEGYRLAGTPWTADRVVVATGPWPSPDAPAGPAVRTKRVAALHADLPVEPGDPLVFFVDEDLFVLPDEEGSALVSFYREVWDVDPAALTGRADEDDLLAGTAALRRRSPAAAGAVTGGRAFCDGYAEHRLPLVIPHPGRPGLVSVRGGSGSGVRLAPGLAAEALRAAGLPAPAPRPAVPAGPGPR